MDSGERQREFQRTQFHKLVADPIINFSYNTALKIAKNITQKADQYGTIKPNR